MHHREELLTAKQVTSILKWTLYTLLFLFSMLLQTVILPRMRINGIALTAVPVCIACVAVWEGSVAGGVYGILCGMFYSLSGVDCGPIFVLTFAISAVLSGGICEHYTVRGFISSLILSLMSLMICQTLAFIFRVYANIVALKYWSTVLIPEILLSILLVPIFYVGARVIAKIRK